MTQQEIIKRELNGEELLAFGGNMENLFDCMDLYAEQESIVFAEWAISNEWMVTKNLKGDRYWFKIDSSYHDPSLSDSQIYKEFKNETHDTGRIAPTSL